MSRPETLHLIRLAASRAGKAFLLHQLGENLEVILLDKPLKDSLEGCTYLCLEGELLLDLKHGDFLHLKRGEATRLEIGVERTLTPVGKTTVLMWRGE